MKLYLTNPLSPYCAITRVAADMAGQTVEVVIVDDAMKKTLAAKNTTGLYPMLETSEGCINESFAIAKYFCTLAGGKFLGSNNVEKALVDQWIAFVNTSLTSIVKVIRAGIFQNESILQSVFNENLKNLKAQIKVLNTELEGKKFLVGDEATLADVAVAVALIESFQTVLDGGFRKAMKNVEAWATATLELPSIVKVFGKVQMAAKPLKPFCKADPKPEKKKAAPAPAKKEKKEEKVKDNVESLPPTPFNVYDFKTFFVNEKDMRGKGVDTWYEQLDWEGWSFWFLHYDKYGSEGTVLHVTNNLLSGFLSRAEHTSKYTFARMAVIGEEPSLDIEGVWLFRGQEVPDGLSKGHPQFEYYQARKMDPRNVKADDTLVREFFAGKEGDMANGKKIQTTRWHK